MKKTVGAKAFVVSSSGDYGIALFSVKSQSLLNLAHTRTSYVLMAPLTILPLLLCCAFFDFSSRASSSDLFLRTATRILPLHSAAFNRPAFLLGEHAALSRLYKERSLASQPFTGKNGSEEKKTSRNVQFDLISDGLLNNDTKETTKECDLFDGKWIRDDGFNLAYSPEGCPFIDQAFRCKENGRMDSQYLKWRWQPRGCNLLRFDGKAMLERLRGRRMVFVGDSLGRNQWESLLCMLSEVTANKTSIYEENGNPISKHKGFLSIRFDDYNCTVEYYRTPFLVRRAAAPAGSPERVKSVLLLDAMHSTSHRWESADILIFNAGHWWTYERTLKSGWYFQERGELKEDMELEAAFTRAMRTWREWINTKVDNNNTSIFFTSYSPPHYRGGNWNMGGRCHHYTQPSFNSSDIFVQDLSWTNKIISNVIAQNSEKSVTFLDITQLTSYRHDGHPSLWYGERKVGSDFLAIEDCSHWCLPGVPDVWNELMYTFLSKDTQHKQLQVY